MVVAALEEDGDWIEVPQQLASLNGKLRKQASANSPVAVAEMALKIMNFNQILKKQINQSQTTSKLWFWYLNCSSRAAASYL